MAHSDSTAAHDFKNITCQLHRYYEIVTSTCKRRRQTCHTYRHCLHQFQRYHNYNGNTTKYVWRQRLQPLPPHVQAYLFVVPLDCHLAMKSGSKEARRPLKLHMSHQSQISLTWKPHHQHPNRSFHSATIPNLQANRTPYRKVPVPMI